jgi:iron-sulfur cluster assembly protein
LMIDYVKQGLQTKFVYQNPMQTGQCGCGESFTILDK